MTAAPGKISVEAAQNAFRRLGKDWWIGIDSPVFSRYLPPEEADRFEELPMSQRPLDHGIPSPRATIGAGASGEPVAGTRCSAAKDCQS
ncbi:hypothetical protein [Rhizobium sp. GN54]|uniref:hypothetical protein n=1 Tax=Rhizobium sp. GN54 TaxID=2898150 RepID=UPI001E28BEA9|nr:hypothetical protein [Rhizobium sp. GN54]MCD2180570.1 hypothetical protein [Rhizobium sp. GN54]